ncbi:MAG: hypothetical protein UR26_C0001G0152 [candidate division TM6 bacterium GW2011_GWF2_32_72]|nr:MAG: hypothetical protein UR26_C0001G0152 [candidate division TM6 bacterium GW2011_GWF2_32_72]
MKKSLLVLGVICGFSIVEASKFNCNFYKNSFLKVSPNISNLQISTNPDDLLIVARGTLEYISRFETLAYIDFQEKSNRRDMLTGLLSCGNYDIDDFRQTLQFIISTIELGQKRGFHVINDPDFLKQHFDFIKWGHPCSVGWGSTKTILDKSIKLTQYAIFKVKGSSVKTEKFHFPLYLVPSDEYGMSKEQAEEQKDKLLRFKYTRAQILKGALWNNGLTKPLVWLDKNGFHEALMQGSIFVIMPDGKERKFQVARDNGFSDPSKRYLFFSEVMGEKSKKVFSKPDIELRGQSCFAGDVNVLGFGKLICIKFKNKKTGIEELKLGVLADTGGAFIDNPFQLDFFMGIFDNRMQFKDAISLFPDNVEAFILIKK